MVEDRSPSCSGPGHVEVTVLVQMLYWGALAVAGKATVTQPAYVPEMVIDTLT